MKKLIRLIFKLPLTFVVVPFLAFGVVMFNGVRFFQWVYDADKFSKEVTIDCIDDMKLHFKKWFTTI